MKKDFQPCIEDILESISKIEAYTKGIELDEFLNNTERQDAVLRRLEIIGEAVKKIPDEIRMQYNEIPWKQIAVMRDMLIHEYSGVSLERVWKVLSTDLQPLKNTSAKILDVLRHKD